MPAIRIPDNLVEQLAEHGILVSDVVLYITSACNLRCAHCYVGNALLDAVVRYEGSDLEKLIRSFGKLDRMTILGGEPLLHPAINVVVEAALQSDIRERRITSNLTGFFQFDVNRFVGAPLTICVSLDGANAVQHETIRGAGTFDKTVRNIVALVERGYDVEVTHTVTTVAIDQVWSIVALCRSLGIQKLNFHKISAHGNARANPELMITPSDWINLRRELFAKTLAAPPSASSGLQVRIPILFATPNEYRELTSTGRYWPMANGSYYSGGEGHRVVLYPDGRLYMSSEFFGTDSFIGHIQGEKFVMNTSSTNEMQMSVHRDAAVDRDGPDDSSLIELSYSFKETRFVV